MPRGPVPTPIVLTPAEREELERWQRRLTTARALAQRARAVLLLAGGDTAVAVADKVGATRESVGRWRARFAESRCDGLLDEPRPGRPRSVSDAQVEEIVRKTLETRPRGATQWSTRDMAKACGVSQTTVSRIWRAFSLQPHRQDTFKLSEDPLFIEKVRDIVGLYLAPPERAVVLCVDEKSQIQALDRTQPLLPMRPGQAERRTHDYVRHGTTTLFAALDVATGKVAGRCFARHRAREFRLFLDDLDRQVPAHLDVHLVIDNASSHKTPAIRRWLARRPRFHMHFTPTSSSWINQVERFFAEITRRQIKRGAHRSTRSLERAIREYLAVHNEAPKPYRWTKSADEILGALARYCAVISDSGH
jgi:transposase